MLQSKDHFQTKLNVELLLTKCLTEHLNHHAKLKLFCENYCDKYKSFVQQLGFIYTFMDFVIAFTDETPIHRIEILNLLMNAFNDKDLHLSEVKTMLLVSNGFVENPIIAKSRLKLADIYNDMKIELQNKKQ